MPVATIDPNEYERFELKTAPPDGFVMLRPLPYGMILERQDKTMVMQMKGRRPQDRRKKGGGAEELPDIDLKNLNAVATQYDFAFCIGDHNLTDKQGTLLDFGNAMVFNFLNPRVAQEIASLIDDLNNPEDTEMAEDFLKRVSLSPGEDQT